MSPPHTSKQPIRVVIVDDSPVARRLMELVLSRCEGVEIAAILSDGASVERVLKSQSVDVLILDLEMPDVDGLRVLGVVAAHRQRLGVVVYSAAPPSVVAEARQVVDSKVSLRVVTKGADAGGGLEGLNRTLAPMVLELGQEIRRGRRGQASEQASAPAAPIPSGRQASPSSGMLPGDRSESSRRASRGPRIGVLVIGASTGGPDALKVMLEAIPADIGIPMALVQHMPAGFTAQLAERLNSHCAIEVREAQDGERMVPGCLLVAPGGKHLEIHRSGPHLEAKLTEGPPENSCRPAVDVLFRSAAEAMPRNLLAAVLTGMGQDGLIGAECIRKTGGSVLVQDEATSVVWGMPGAIAKAGEADEVLPLEDLAFRITARVRRSADVAGRSSR
ncbi:MAG: chemotaxis-specific protein-glutamate methyltransferase CheB [Planctomycetota bacterium]